MQKVRSSIARRLIVVILLSSLAVTFTVTALSLYSEYKKTMKSFGVRLDEIESALLPGIVNNLRITDYESARIQLEVLLHIPGVQYAAISQDGGNIVTVGKFKPGKTISRNYPLVYSSADRNINLGTLHVTAGLEEIREKITNEGIIILQHEFIEVFVLSSLLFLFFYFLVGRHLIYMSDFMKTMNYENLDRALVLKKRGKKIDEIDQLALSINAMRENMARDIAERKHGEKMLRESEEKYRRIIENLRTDYFFYSYNANGVFTYLSPSISNVLGYTPDEFLTHYTEYLTGNPVNREVEKRTELSTKGITQGPHELEIYHRDGGIRWLKVTEVPVFNNEGKVIAVEGIAHDITAGKIADEQKRRLEEQLRQAQKIEAVGILAGGIAHDFNNILNAIMGFSYLARLKTREDSEAAAYLNNLMEATNRAVELVRQILVFSRKGAGELQPIIITPVVKEALKMLRASIPSTIEIRQHIVSEKYILGDPTQIHQIIMNLCTNSYHAMQDTGGVMEVRVEDIDIGPDLESLIADIKQGPHVRLTVSDTGRGIDPSVIDKIFDPYFTTKGMGKGTGLGLSVVHGIIKQCGGSITVSSKLNNGSSFQVLFPVVQLEAPGERKTREALMRGTETVLVADDEESIVTITGEILKGLGYNVVISTDSEEALSLFRERPGRFDVVFTDMTMPKMTGFQLSKAILGIRPDVPIILATGYSEGLNEETVKKSGIRELLIKPVSPEKLSRAIRKALEN